MPRCFLAAALAAALLVPAVHAQTAAPPRALQARPALAAQRVDGSAVELDGRLDEPAWAAAPAATGFVQREPTPGAAASQATEARVLYDGRAVYVGMRMHDAEVAAIQAPLGRRDADLPSDWALVAFDSYDDRRTAFLFAVNPAGVQLDKLLYNDVNEDDSWDAVWDVAVSRDADGWTAEFRIPLSQLRYAAGAAEQSWGIQFGRDLRRTAESAFWAPLPPDQNGLVSLFGRLDGLRDLSSPRRFEAVPYVSTALTRAPGDAADPFYRPTDAAPRAGVDLKLGLSSDLTLSATVNPDFGQVEADPAQINLGGFELFLDERRPFFVEGADVFSFGRTRAFFNSNRPTFLYTRRIGRAPLRTGVVPGDARDAAGPDGAVYTDAPGQTDIVGAAKVSGRLGGVAVGALAAVTQPAFSRFAAFDAAGRPVADGESLADPRAAFTVLRARGQVGRTQIGGLATLVARDLADPAFAALEPRTATVAGLDVEHDLGGDWIASGVLAASHLAGTADAITRQQRAFPRLFQRPDAGHLALDPTATTLSGLTAEAAITKAGGTHWLGSLSAAVTSPGFDSNALGFQSRADWAYVGGGIIYNQNTPQGAFQNWSANAFSAVGGNLAGDLTMTFLNLEASGTLRSFWRLSGNVGMGPRTPDDRLTRGGPLATDPAGVDVNLNLRTDSRKRVTGYTWLSAGRNEIGNGRTGIEVGVTARPRPELTVGLYPGVSQFRTARQFLDASDAPDADATFGRRYLFAQLDGAEFSMSTSVDWTFSPQLSLQLFARPFVAAGQYTRPQVLTAPRQMRLPTVEEAGGTVAGTADGGFTVTLPDGGAPQTLRPNYAVRAIQGNAVLRWEFRPGSALFLVWQQARDGFEPDGRFRLGPNLGRAFSDVSTNVFLAKLSYWIG